MEDWQSFDWTEVTPIPPARTAEGLAQIAYSEDYSRMVGYLRPLMAQRELSERALALTSALIAANPAHYSVWDYRLDIVKKVGPCVFGPEASLVKDTAPAVCESAKWIDETTLENPKNYQVWNYRRNLETPTSSGFHRGEALIAGMVIDDDPKNFHAWSHLKWAVERAQKYAHGFDLTELLVLTDKKLAEDVYNNSAWSFRFFLFSLWNTVLADKSLFKAEVDYVRAKIEQALDNEASWRYLQGIVDTFAPGSPELVEAATACADKSNQALAILAESNNSSILYDRLSDCDPSRAGYWNYKKSLLTSRQMT